MSATERGTTSAAAFPADPLDPRSVTGLILCGMGGPDGPGAVEPFLRNLFRDPAILPLPRWLAPVIGGWIARRRAPAVRARYAHLGHGGGSGQLEWTRRQGVRLQELLDQRAIKVIAHPAMCYWHPFAPQAIESLLTTGARQFLVIPAYPQYAGATSGNILRRVQQALAEGAPGRPAHFVAAWHLLSGYLQALADRIEPALRGWSAAAVRPEECALLFVAHSLPERFIRDGDPYRDQTQATVTAVHQIVQRRLIDAAGRKPGERGRDAAWWMRLPGVAQPLLAYQSRVGPIKWIGPEVRAEVRRLVEQGCRRLMLQPLSFTCENIETLHELDIELAAEAEQMGITEFRRGAALNLDEGWLRSLADLLARTAYAPAERRAHV